jgi:ABC-2 type transport system ATP-binding protein
MRQRLAIAAGLLQPRELLILDEPTNGLDPQGTREVRALISEVAAGGATVMLSTHLLAEVEQICTHVGVMHVGTLLTQGTIADLRSSTIPRVRLDTTNAPDALATFNRLGLTDTAVEPGAVTAVLGDVAPEQVVAALVRAGVPVRSFTVVAPSLEDVFVSLTGEGFDVSG